MKMVVSNHSILPAENINVECYCFFDPYEEEYFICGSSSVSGGRDAGIYKYFIKKRSSVLEMLDVIAYEESNNDVQDSKFEVSLVNFPNLLMEEYIDYAVLNGKFHKHKMNYEMDCYNNNKIYYDNEFNIVAVPSIISKLSYDKYSDDVYETMEKYVNLLKKVRW
jgi:hypothetical protein